MRRPVPTIAVMIGMPHGEEGPQDEDSLNREQDDNSGNDEAADWIVELMHALKREGPPAIRLMRLFTQALEAMCDAVMARDDAALEDAASDAHKALNEMM